MLVLSCKGSFKNKSAILSVEAPVWQDAKTQEYQDILRFRNASRRDASALKRSSYFCTSPEYNKSFRSLLQSYYLYASINFTSNDSSMFPNLARVDISGSLNLHTPSARRILSEVIIDVFTFTSFFS